MMKINDEVSLPSIILAIGLAILISLVTFQPYHADESKPDLDSEGCLTCHNDPSLSITLPNGDVLPLYVTQEMMDQSVHTDLDFNCQTCHSDIEEYPHPEIKYNSHRELAREYYLQCQKCHSDNYEETLDSMHAQVAVEGNLDAPICTDCHGTHNIRQIAEPRTFISDTCKQCHTAIYDEYVQSIHGTALVDEDNHDVPVCTDCHGVHMISDPRTTEFHIQTPEMCAGCHADDELMRKYGLSTDVYDIYKISWHGVDVSVYEAKWPTIWHRTAVCTDCHGIHNIFETSNPKSLVNPGNLLATCQECHPNAGPNWTEAWTGHNEISLERTPFIFYTEVFYSTLVPIVLWVSGIYVGLQIIRATVDRVTRSI
jgi:predicted CXXCH cytochrome family protein